MEPQTFEGTWEEVSRHAAELAGHRVRLTVLDTAHSPLMLDATLADFIKEAEQLAASRPPAPTPADAWGDSVTEKFQRRGFTL